MMISSQENASCITGKPWIPLTKGQLLGFNVSNIVSLKKHLNKVESPVILDTKMLMWRHCIVFAHTNV